MSELCFHCGLPRNGARLTANVSGREEPVCCLGCRAVAELISGSGLADYYRFRTATPPSADAATLADDAWATYAKPEIAAKYVRSSNDHDAATLVVDGLQCSACAWLIDRVLRQTPGVIASETNAATGRVHVRWNRERATLADIMRAISRAGYRPCPSGDHALAQQHQAAQRAMLRRLAVAGFGMMQVMMFAVAEYSATLNRETIAPNLHAFMRLISMLVATPVLFYAGAPIFAGAWRAVRSRSVGMDVPIAVALLLAYAASVYDALRDNTSALYFDSVTMFIFFVLLGRFVQTSLRHRTLAMGDALARQLPNLAHKMTGEGVQDVAASSLVDGDTVLVRPSELLPSDGTLLDTAASIDESLLNGESLPVIHRAGDTLAGGTLNAGNAIRLRVVVRSGGTIFNHILALVERAQAQKPAIASAADASSGRFLLGVLLLAALTCAAWIAVDPSHAFSATLAVLVAACPCAYAIALPAALSASMAHLARQGVLVGNPNALENLARADRVVFDKTGTLTLGRLRILECIASPGVDRTRCLEIAAALESVSEHAIARAFPPANGTLTAQDARNYPGQGIEGSVDGRTYRIGTPEFVCQPHGAAAGTLAPVDSAATVVVLGDEEQLLAQFELGDEVRDSAASAVVALRHLGTNSEILSGDRLAAVTDIGLRAGIAQFIARCTPEEKLARVQALQANGHRVVMVGDGVNDVPVLATADVSIAMGRGTALAQASADIILISPDLNAIPAAIALARRTLHIARQNLTWSAIYNFGSLPLAALGLVPPWLAALGMSLSSVLVVLNATRLLPGSRMSTAVPPITTKRAPVVEKRAAPEPQES